MNRKEFIQLTATASAAAMLPWSCAGLGADTKYKLGYQVYSIRDRMVKDPVGTLKELKAMGYEDFETYGFDADTNKIYGYTPQDFKAILNEMELTVSSGHYGLSAFMDASDDELRRYVDACISAASVMDNKYITWPFIEEPYRNLDGYSLLAKKLKIIGQQISETDLGFAFHNHGYEFADLGNGLTGYDIIADRTDPQQVKFQMDMYWVMHQGKTTPKELVAKYPGRYVMWHIKDMHKVSRDYTELGNGSINYHEILPDPVSTGLEYFYIEQGGNFTENSTASAAASAAYFKKELRQYF